jgi:ribosomal protein S18 acetylase RimI-like enzyme
MTGIQYRNATHGDIKKLLEMMDKYYRYEGFAFNAEKSRHTIERLLQNEDFGQLILIQMNGLVIGYFCLAYSFTLEKHGRDCCIDELYLEPQYRNKGIGSHTMKHIESLLASKGFKSMYLLVYNRNKAAFRYYVKNGFRKEAGSFMTKAIGRRDTH